MVYLKLVCHPRARVKRRFKNESIFKNNTVFSFQGRKHPDTQTFKASRHSKHPSIQSIQISKRLQCFKSGFPVKRPNGRTLQFLMKWLSSQETFANVISRAFGCFRTLKIELSSEELFEGQNLNECCRNELESRLDPKDINLTSLFRYSDQSIMTIKHAKHI